MTLVEKLKEIYDMLCCKAEDEEDECFASTYRANVDGFKWALDIVKQHQTWRKMPSDEKPQDMQAYNLLLKNDSSEYPTLYSVGLFRQYASGHVWLSLVEAETYIDESKILAWQPMNEPNNDFFESLEQPPSEVQDD